MSASAIRGHPLADGRDGFVRGGGAESGIQVVPARDLKHAGQRGVLGDLLKVAFVLADARVGAGVAEHGCIPPLFIIKKLPTKGATKHPFDTLVILAYCNIT